MENEENNVFESNRIEFLPVVVMLKTCEPNRKKKNVKTETTRIICDWIQKLSLFQKLCLS